MRRALSGFRAASFDPRHLGGLDAAFGASVSFDAIQPSGHNHYAGTDFADGWAHVVASTGCLGTCAFCAIRRATGRPKSRTIREILAEIEGAVSRGAHDVLLVSTDLSAWGTDRGETVVDLLRAVADAPGDFLVSGESFEPTLFLAHFEALFPVLSGGRFAFVGLPIQSGSARVLRRMERTYDPDAVVAAASRLREAGVLVRTDILYGFGDETDDEFEASLRASRAFDLPSFNAYQPRPGTAPLTLPEAVLRERRDRAEAELQRRAEAGVPVVRRWGRPAEHRTPVAGPAYPWDTPEGRGWIAGEARRFAAVIARKGPMAVGDGWMLVAARPETDGVRLTLRGSRELTLGLRAPEWPGEAVARTSRYAVWVCADEFVPSEAEDRAIKRVVAALGG
jgi:hypothetical protein